MADRVLTQVVKDHIQVVKDHTQEDQELVDLDLTLEETQELEDQVW